MASDERERARAELRDTLVGWVGGDREATELKLDALDRYLDARAGLDAVSRVAELEAALKDSRRIRADDLAHLAKVDRELDAAKSGAISMKAMAEQACKERDEAVTQRDASRHLHSEALDALVLSGRNLSAALKRGGELVDERDAALARIAELERENACVACQERIARIAELEALLSAWRIWAAAPES